MDRGAVVGNWDIGYREISIMDQGDALVLTCPEAPPGYEGHLVELEEGRFRIEGGPLHRAEIVVGRDGPSLGGQRPLSPLDRAARAAPGSGLTAPPLHPDRHEERAFEHLWTWVAHPSRAPEVDPGSIDLSRFVQWLTGRDLALFHGSNLTDLDRLEPGPAPASLVGAVDDGEVVVANQDALCCMFPAVVDQTLPDLRAIHRVERFYAPEGGHVDLYHFSLPRPVLERRPFRPGGLYLLPRERFRPVTLYPGGPPSAEWMCPEPVRPLACLLVTPDDFPLRRSIGASA